MLAQAKNACYPAFVSSEATQIQPRPIYKAEKPVRDPLYRRFIKRLPCVACDLKCIPLCRKCHEAFDADPYGFASKHKLDVPALIARFNKFYFERIAA